LLYKYFKEAFKINWKTNVVNELKAKCPMNDLKGIWKTIKTASNLPVKANNINNNRDAEVTNKYFAEIGPKSKQKYSYKMKMNFYII
jgi:hypothetical protein